MIVPYTCLWYSALSVDPVHVLGCPRLADHMTHEQCPSVILNGEPAKTGGCLYRENSEEARCGYARSEDPPWVQGCPQLEPLTGSYLWGSNPYEPWVNQLNPRGSTLLH